MDETTTWGASVEQPPPDSDAPGTDPVEEAEEKEDTEQVPDPIPEDNDPPAEGTE